MQTDGESLVISSMIASHELWLIQTEIEWDLYQIRSHDMWKFSHNKLN